MNAITIVKEIALLGVIGIVNAFATIDNAVNIAVNANLYVLFIKKTPFAKSCKSSPYKCENYSQYRRFIAYGTTQT